MLACDTESFVSLTQAVWSAGGLSLHAGGNYLEVSHILSQDQRASQVCPVCTGEILTFAWCEIKFQLLIRGFITWSLGWREASTLWEGNGTKHTQDLDAEGFFFSKQMPEAESMVVFSFRNVNKFCYFKSMMGTEKTGFKYPSKQLIHSAWPEKGLDSRSARGCTQVLPRDSRCQSRANEHLGMCIQD